jgi:hypothetical protein
VEVLLSTGKKPLPTAAGISSGSMVGLVAVWSKADLVRIQVRRRSGGVYVTKKAKRFSPNNCNHHVCILEAKLLCSLNYAISGCSVRFFYLRYKKKFKFVLGPDKEQW